MREREDWPGLADHWRLHCRTQDTVTLDSSGLVLQGWYLRQRQHPELRYQENLMIAVVSALAFHTAFIFMTAWR